MKSTGIVRRVDALGRIVLPKELRTIMNIKESVGYKDGSCLEIYTEDDKIILKKYEPCCIFCKEAKGVINFRGKLICKDCLEDIKENA